jgi:flagellar biosynthesis GTPase FlhF
LDEKKLEMWLQLGKFLIGTVVLGSVTTIVSWQIQLREVELKELELLGKFVEHALDENPTVRYQFADYFATVSQSEDFRNRWEIYKANIEKDLAKLRKKEEEERREKEAQEKELQKSREVILQLQSTLSELKSDSAADRETIAEREKSLQQAQAEALRKDRELARLQASLSATQSDLTYQRREERSRPAGKSGWVYLGEYDSSSQQWITRYWNIGIDASPQSLEGKSLRVTASAVNVRNDSNPWSPILDALAQNTPVQVEAVNRWGLTDYFWASVVY